MARERKKSEFGKYLAQLIKDAGMTQCDFYSEAEIARPYFTTCLVEERIRLRGKPLNVCWMCWRNGSHRMKSAARSSLTVWQSAGARFPVISAK